jgi:hypothetical protein
MPALTQAALSPLRSAASEIRKYSVRYLAQAPGETCRPHHETVFALTGVMALSLTRRRVQERGAAVVGSVYLVH